MPDQKELTTDKKISTQQGISVLQRRIEIWQGARPRIEHAHQQQEHAEALLQHETTHEHNKELEQLSQPIPVVPDQTVSVDCRGFQEAVIAGKLTLPESILKKYPNCRRYINEKNPELRPNYELMFRESLETIWDIWLGNVPNKHIKQKTTSSSLYAIDETKEKRIVRIFPDIHRQNPLVNKIKLSAIEQLLKHDEQSQWGFDYEQPPEGFILQGKVLNYVPGLRIPATRTRVEVTYANQSSSRKEQKIAYSGMAAQWWQQLSAVHLKYNPHDDMLEVQRAFQAFLDYIAQHKLQLPPPLFNSSTHHNIKSLPLTLGRMVALLNNCSPQNRQHQLNCIPLLDLGNTGAIRAIREPAYRDHYYHFKRCQFVVPGMNCQATHFGNYHGYLTYYNDTKDIENVYTAARVINVYTASMKSHTGHRFSPSDTKEGPTHEAASLSAAIETFWRYLAHTDSMPLSFYMDTDNEGTKRPGAVARIEEFKNPEIKAHLYCLLAKLTTGAGVMNHPDVEKMLEHWNKVCDLFMLMAKQPSLAIEGLETLQSFPVVPPLYLLDKIITLCYKWCSSVFTISSVIQSFERLDKLLGFLNPAPARLYHGMRHCQRDYKGEDPFLNPKNSLFLDYLNKFEKIKDTCSPLLSTDAATMNAVNLLFQSLDTFALKESDIEKCVTEIKKSPDAKSSPSVSNFFTFQKYCIDIINEMTLEHQPALSTADLNQLLAKIRKLHTNSKLRYDTHKIVAFINYLQKKYANYFPENFLLNKKIYYQNQLDEAVQQEIKKLPLEQRPLIKELLGLHPIEPVNVQIYFLEAVQNLSTMCSSYDFNLTDCLARLLDYEKANDRTPKQHALEYLSQFFTLITNEHNIGPLESLLYQPEMEKVPHLIQKGIILYETIAPWLSLHQNEVSQQLSYAPACEVFFASPAEELVSDVKTINPELDEQVQKLKDTLSDDKVTIEALSTAVDALLLNTIYCQDKNLIQAWFLLKSDEEKKSLGNPQADEKEKKIEVKKEQDTVKPDKPLTMFEKIQQYAIKKSTQLKTALAGPMGQAYAPKKPTDSFTSSTLSSTGPEHTNLQLAKNELKQFIINAKDYRYFILNYYEKIYALIKEYPKIKVDLLKYISHFAQQFKSTGEMRSYAEVLQEQLAFLQSAATFFADETVFRDVLYHGHHMQKPNELIEYFKIIRKYRNEKGREELYQLLAKLIGESITIGPPGPAQKKVPIITLASFQLLCERCSDQKETLSLSKVAIFNFYKNPPYPILADVLRPYQNTSTISGANETVLANFTKHNQQPYAPNPRNAFHLADAQKQAMLFSNNHLFPGPVLKALADRIQHYRAMPTSAKIKHLADNKENFKKMNELKGQEQLVAIADLTALLSELLFCTANQEFDYTQVLALYSQLACQGKAVHQISTGRGKSRIAMGLCAGKLLMGGNPDFATDTMKLAEEAYYTTKPFFKACGIDTLLLDVSTPLADYYPKDKKALISFSSRDELGLFHNRIQSEIHDYPEKENSVLIIDEGDKFYADLGKLHLNLAVQDTNPEHDFTWVYEYIYNFSKENNFYTYYINTDLTEVFQQLIAYVRANTPSTLKERNDRFEKFANAHPATIETWLRAALTARTLEEGNHFDATVAQDVPLLTRAGMRIASKALVKIDNLVSQHSIYSDAVQQFLHVRLNQERALERAHPTGKKISKTPYHIEPISYVMFSSTAYSLLNRYQQWFGLTGSSGSALTHQEMGKRFKGLVFIDVPDHKPNQRTDLLPQVVKNKKQQLAKLKKYHQTTAAENRPHIIITKNDNNSQTICDELKKARVGKVQQLDGTLQNYDAVLRQAGDGGQTTSSTRIVGRGVDVKVSSTANHIKGMAVTVDHVQNTADKIQSFGRAGRREMPGTAQLLINLEALKKEFALPDAVDSPELIGLFINRDDFIKRLHLRVDQQEQQVRCTNTLIIDFFDHIFKDYAQLKLKLTNSQWTSFLNGLNENIKNPLTDSINKLLEQRPIAVEKIINEIQSLFKQATEEYNKFLQQSQIKSTFVPPEYDYETLTKQLSTEDLKALDIPVSRTTYAEYDEAHAGCNVVYHSLFARTRWALKQLWARQFNLSEIFFQHQKAASEQLGLPHPEWKAYWSGQRQLFANTRAFLRGNLNREWQHYEQAYVQLDRYAKNEAKGAQIVAAQTVLAAVKLKATKIGNKKELELLTKVLHETYLVMTSPGDTTYNNYNQLRDEVAQYQKWESIKHCMAMVAGVTLLAGFAALAVFSHGLAAPIAFYGIKLSLTLITGAAYSLLGVGSLLSTIGLFGIVDSTNRNISNAVNQANVCPIKKGGVS